MKILKINPENLRESRQAIEEAVSVIKKGGIVVFPTDTVYGLAADATNEAAVRKIFKIKKRPEDKPVPLLISDLEMAKKLSYFDKRVEKILLSIWPGTITVLLQAKGGVLPWPVTAGRQTIGLRIPDYKIAHFLTVKCGVPLVATSANISGKPSSNKISGVIAQFEKAGYKPDIIFNAGDLKHTEPSTVLDFSKGKPIITRVGLVNKKKLFDIIGV
jgi:L-threonylcarbamoyladenylate synthase